jgi:ABC-2 type transport system permease protein
MHGSLKILSTSFKEALAYRFNLFLYSFGTLFQILVMVAIWTALQSQGQIGEGYSYRELVSFSILNFALTFLFSTFSSFFFLTDKIRKGDVILELLRPVGFLRHLFFRNIGGSLFRLLFVFIPLLLIAYFGFGMLGPSSLPNFLAAVGASVLGYGINFLIWFLFGLLTFYSLDNMGTLLLFMATIQFLSARVVPLQYYPEFLQSLLNFLPFKSIYYEPTALYLGKIALDKLPEVFLFQGIWLLGLLALAGLCWMGISRRLVIQGG